MNSLPEAKPGRCPITGLPVWTRPEWTHVQTGPRTTVTVSLIGDSILDIKSFGERTPETQEPWETLRRQIHAELIPPGRKYVELFDLTRMSGLPGADVRRKHSQYHLSDAYKDCLGCFTYGSSLVVRGLFRTGIALAGRNLKYPFRIVKDYEEAVTGALRLLEQASGLRFDDGESFAYTDFTTRPEWCVSTQNGLGEVKVFECRGRILLMEFHGILDEVEIVTRVVGILDRIFDEGHVAGKDYLRITDYSHLKSSSMAVRMRYAQELKPHFDRHRSSLARTFVIGSTGWVRAALFFALKMSGFSGKLEFFSNREDCFERLGRILVSRGEPVGRSVSGETELITLRRSEISKVTTGLGALAWDQDESDDSEAFPDGHPLSDVWEAIRLVKSDYRAVLDKHKEAERLALAASQAKSEFLANMSHEIRTPLNGVIGMLQLMLQEKLPAQEKQYASIALTSAKSLLSIINDILDISKIEAGRIEREDVVFQLRECLAEFSQIAQYQAKEKGLVFRAEVDEAVPDELIGDLVRIRQIMSNLVGNAIKFTSRGEVRAGIRVLSRLENSIRLRFSVEDSGIGIQQDKLEAVFESFNQADTSTTRKYGGTGLGLAISRQLARILGGDLHVSSRPGEGSLFWFDLDLGTDVEERIAQGILERATCGGKSSSQADAPDPTCSYRDVESSTPAAAGEDGERRVLVVEDNAINMKVAQGLLGRMGYSSVAAENGVVALKRLQAEPFDLILMDCQMPVMDGFETARQIRSGAAGDRNRAIPIVALTAAAHDSDREMVMQAGMDDYLTKPFSLRSLREVVERWGAAGTRADPRSD